MAMFRRDFLTDVLAQGGSRRAALTAGGAALAMAGLGALAVSDAAAGGQFGSRAAPARLQGATPVAGAADWAPVEALAREAERTGGVVGVAVHAAGRELFARHGARRFRAASTVKVPVMIEAYRQSERGALSLDERYVLRDEDRIPGTGVLAHLHAGLELTFADLLYLMIAVSDNTATNRVIDRVGLDAVNVTMRSLGMVDSTLGRPMLGRLPTAGDPENWATPSDYAVAIDAIVNGDAASPESCARMMETLELQNETRRISRFLPDGAGLRWGTKPGDLPGFINDVGFVSSERGTLAIAVYCENLPGLDDAERTIGEIALTALELTGMLPTGTDAAAP